MCCGERDSSSPGWVKMTLSVLLSPKMVSAAESRVKDCIHPVQSSVVPCRAVPCLTVAQLSVAPHGADSLVLSKCLTAAPLPCAACGLISLDERCQRRSNSQGDKRQHRKTEQRASCWNTCPCVPFKPGGCVETRKRGAICIHSSVVFLVLAAIGFSVDAL